jgi:glycosyltransferase involved in cell wall biosynthesis
MTACRRARLPHCADVFPRKSLLRNVQQLKNNTRLLLLNWRDPWHPQAGGAELLTWRICERLAERGWTIEWFSARYPGAPSDEMRSGIRFVRAGTQLSVHWNAFWRYRADQRFDCIVEEINTLPFFTPLYLRAPKAAFFCQLAREVWQFEAPRGLRAFGYFVEPLYLRPYSRLPLITISPSSAASLREVGLRGRTYIIPMAVDEAPLEAPKRDAAPYDVIVVGRLTPSKRVEHCIAAAEIFARLGWTGKLHVVGDGRPRYVESLHRYASAFPKERIIFHGRVDDARRRALLLESSALWGTSIREGWGLVVTEAARCATPAVVYDVAGLRDAVVDRVTGYVVPQDPQALALATQELFAAEYSTFSRNALERSQSYSWDQTADAFESALEQTIAA